MNKVCGAKLRKKNATCKKKPISESGRCRLHGGNTPKGIASPNFKTGATSKYAFLPKTLLSRAETLLTDTLKNLEESIQIQKTLETQYLEKLGTNESTEAWKRLRQAVSEYEQAQFIAKNDGEKAQAQAKAFGMIKWLVNEGLSESFLHLDITRCHESQRKMTETLSKCRKEQQEIYTQEELNQILGIFLGIVKRNVSDRSVLSTIQDEITAFSRRESDADAPLVG